MKLYYFSVEDAAYTSAHRAPIARIALCSSDPTAGGGVTHTHRAARARSLSMWRCFMVAKVIM